MEFAVSVEGLTEEGQALWVLAVDAVGERLLLVHGDGTMHWHPLAECVFSRAATPEQPRPVIPVQPQGAPGALALPNRAMRREIERNGA